MYFIHGLWYHESKAKGDSAMEIRILKYFLAVAQEGNITRAAERLLTSQSNLSRQLADLENQLGKRLFERGSRKIHLTEEGLFLQRRAQEIVDLEERTAKEIAAFDDMTSGEVHLGGAETNTMHFVADVIRQLRDKQPHVTFDLMSGSTIEMTELLDRGLLDFAVLVEPIDMKKYDYLQLPANDHFGLLMRADNPLAAKSVITPSDIQNQPLLCARQQLDGNVLNGWLGRPVEGLNVVARFNLITTPAMMVEQGLGSAVTFANLVPTPENGTLCFRPFDPVIEARLYLVWKKHQVFTRPATVFLEEMRTAIRA